MSVKIYFEVVTSFYSKDKNQKIYFAFPFQSFNLRKFLQSKGKLFFFRFTRNLYVEVREKCIENIFMFIKFVSTAQTNEKIYF